MGANPGYGWGSSVHRRVIELLPDFVLEGVCTTREQTARAAAEAFGAPLWFTDSSELARHPDVDLIAICVKAPFHYEIAHTALTAGKHVYCEWPLAFSIEQAEELAALAVERGLKAMIGLHMRGSPAMRQAQRLIADGYLGDLFSINLHARLFGPIMRAMAIRSGGTTLRSIYGGHLLDAVDHYFGGIQEFETRGAIHLPPLDETGAPIDRDAFDHLQFHGRLSNGALFNIDLSGVTMTGMGTTWRIDGREGALILATRDPSLPAIESVVLQGARQGSAFEAIPISAEFECPGVPSEPDRYPAYPGSFASREALSAIANLYTELGEAIRDDAQLSPDFGRAVEIQRLLAIA
ncbi:Gfo/Idh/MocA family protein [Sphingobium herbicidovorans]|uniref:Gfo/Idh/MocA family protein n=1 Tax=Sphingobium herbicidovorans TaxID=76947 RepID=UPI00078930BC|nr:Gfo/Idh/MocA family oxidoreductase [Sphingobium herbicidovorans]